MLVSAMLRWVGIWCLFFISINSLAQESQELVPINSSNGDFIELDPRFSGNFTASFYQNLESNGISEYTIRTSRNIIGVVDNREKIRYRFSSTATEPQPFAEKYMELLLQRSPGLDIVKNLNVDTISVEDDGKKIVVDLFYSFGFDGLFGSLDARLSFTTTARLIESCEAYDYGSGQYFQTTCIELVANNWHLSLFDSSLDPYANATAGLVADLLFRLIGGSLNGGNFINSRLYRVPQ